MVLNFGMFQRPIYGDQGEMEVSVFEQNLAEKAVYTGDMDVGAIIDTYDRDTSTYLECNQTGTGTKTISLDFGKKLQTVVVSIHYSGSVQDDGASEAAHVDVDISDDNSAWTEISTTGSFNSTGATIRYSGEHSFRYLRMQLVTTGGTNVSTGKMYELTVVQR